MDRPELYSITNQEINISTHESILNRISYNDSSFAERVALLSSAKRELELTKYILFLEKAIENEREELYSG